MNDIGRLREAAMRLLESDVVADIPGFTVPAQKRTLIKTAAILATAAHLLQCRDFSDVTVEEIAAGAACSAPSIYARFENKEALLPAVHLLLLEATRQRLNREMTQSRFEGKTLDFFSRVFVKIIDDYFYDNHNFVRAAIVGEVNIVHLQFKSLIPALVERLIKLIERLAHPGPAIEKVDVFFALDLLFALFRDAAVVPSFEKTRDQDALARIFLLALTSKISSRSPRPRAARARPTQKLPTVKSPF